MPLATLKEVLADAARRRYGVGMFNVINVDMLKLAIEVAEEEKSPIIIALAEMHLRHMPMETIAPIMVKAANQASVPVVVHFDRGQSFESIVRAMHYGFTSVMYDGSELPYEKNIRNTQDVVRIAKILGVSVEAALRYQNSADGGADAAVFYTDEDQALDFVKRTDIDALTVIIEHDMDHLKPKLSLERIEAIKKKTGIPLAMRDASRLADDDLKNAIAKGISKLGIMAYMPMDVCASEQQKAAEAVDLHSVDDMVQRVVKRVLAEIRMMAMDDARAEIKRKIKAFGSSGKACL